METIPPPPLFIHSVLESLLGRDCAFSTRPPTRRRLDCVSHQWGLYPSHLHMPDSSHRSCQTSAVHRANPGVGERARRAYRDPALAFAPSTTSVPAALYGCTAPSVPPRASHIVLFSSLISGVCPLWDCSPAMRVSAVWGSAPGRAWAWTGGRLFVQAR